MTADHLTDRSDLARRLGADYAWHGLFRIYYNSRADAPLVWAIDEGTAATERNVRRIECYVPTHTSLFTGKREWPEPTVWMFGKGTVTIIGDLAIIRTRAGE